MTVQPHTCRKPWLACGGILALLMLTAGGASTGSAEGESTDRNPRQAHLQERLTEARARLRLTDEQIERIRPILRSSLEAQARVLQKHGIDLERRSEKDRRLGFRQLRRLGRDLDAVRKQTLGKLSGKRKRLRQRR